MIWITQWLCPDRDCSIALAWDDADTLKEDIEKEGEALYLSGGINRWCGICGSKDLKVEHGSTPFKSLEEAMPYLKRVELANALAREKFGDRY